MFESNAGAVYYDPRMEIEVDQLLVHTVYPWAADWAEKASKVRRDALGHIGRTGTITHTHTHVRAQPHEGGCEGGCCDTHA